MHTEVLSLSVCLATNSFSTSTTEYSSSNEERYRENRNHPKRNEAVRWPRREPEHRPLNNYCHAGPRYSTNESSLRYNSVSTRWSRPDITDKTLPQYLECYIIMWRGHS